MKEELNEIKVLLARIETDLRHHIKRTEMLEGEVREWRSDFKPVQEHVIFVKNLGKFLTVVAAIGASIAAFIALK